MTAYTNTVSTGKWYRLTELIFRKFLSMSPHQYQNGMISTIAVKSTDRPPLMTGGWSIIEPPGTIDMRGIT
jgi:hypothetical protein